VKIDQKTLREHRAEFSYFLNRCITEHLVRLSRAFEGDLTAAVVLGTIGQYNVRRFHDEVVTKSGTTLLEALRSGAHREHLRPCNAMSVASSTGIPRETVRRKIAWLVARGWVRRAGRDQLYIDEGVVRDFAEFNVATVELFVGMLTQFDAAVPRRAEYGTARPRVAARN
jgi:hypothetical protein